jgi:ribosome assembly protein 1
MEYEEEEEEEQAFSPEKGNVAFTSAYDGWGFRTSDFAAMCAAKLGCKAGVLDRALWGDYAFNPRTKRIIRIKASQQDKLKPLFVQVPVTSPPPFSQHPHPCARRLPEFS